MLCCQELGQEDTPTCSSKVYQNPEIQGGDCGDDRKYQIAVVKLSFMCHKIMGATTDALCNTVHTRWYLLCVEINMTNFEYKVKDIKVLYKSWDTEDNKFYLRQNIIISWHNCMENETNMKTPFEHEQAKQWSASNNLKIKFILCKLSFCLRIDFISWWIWYHKHLHEG